MNSDRARGHRFQRDGVPVRAGQRLEGRDTLLVLFTGRFTGDRQLEAIKKGVKNKTGGKKRERSLNVTLKGPSGPPSLILL